MTSAEFFYDARVYINCARECHTLQVEPNVEHSA